MTANEDEQQDIEEIEQEIEKYLADGINIINLDEIRKSMADGIRIKLVKYNHSDFIPKEVSKPEPVVLTKEEESLFKALRDRDVEEVRKILDSGIDVNTKDKDGKTPLMHASNYGCIDIVQVLIERGANYNARDNENNIALNLAYTIEVIQLLAQRHMRGDREYDGSSYLFAGAVEFEEQKELNVAKALFNLHVDTKAISEAVYTADEDDLSTAMVLAAERNDVEEVKRLLGQDVEIDTKIEGQNALMLTTNTEIAQLLIECGIDIEVTSEDNWHKSTALLFHAGRGNLEMVKFLLEVGADIYAYNKYNETAFSLARNYNNVEMLKLLNKAIYKLEALIGAAGEGNIKEVKRLIKLGFDVNSVAIHGITALSEAIFFEHVEIVKLLLKHGAKIHPKSKEDIEEEYTSIFRAIQIGNVEIVKLLLESEESKYSDNKYFIFVGACERGHVEIVRYFIEKKKIDIEMTPVCNSNIQEAYIPHEALTKAIKNNHFKIVELLVKARIHPSFLNQKTCTQGGVRTYLIQSVIDNEPVLAKLLIEGGADLSITDDLLGCSPLMWAVTSNNLEIAKLLIDAKSDLDFVRIFDGKSALMFSRSVEMTRLLIDAGANIHIKDMLGQTVLTAAQESKDIEMCKVLIEKEA